MGFLDKLQFWKKSHSDDLFSDVGDQNMNFDNSFTGTDEQSGFSQGVDSQGVTGEQGELPPLDRSNNDPQQQSGQQFDPSMQGQNQGQFVDPNAHMNQQQQAQNPQQSPQQQGDGNQVTMQTENGERKIGKQLAEEYMNHQSRSSQGAAAQQQQGQQNSGNGNPPSIEHSLELVNVKLDSLKNALDAMSQRLLKIENELEKERKRNW